MAHEVDVVNSAELVVYIGGGLSAALCDHQAFFLIVLDEHIGAMPAAENLTHRPSDERKRAADVLRMWAARIEKGGAPDQGRA